MSFSSRIRRWRAAREFDRFDGVAIGATLVLLIALVGVALAGDQIGVTVAPDDVEPAGSARGAQPVRIRFSEAMDAASVAEHFTLEPSTEGQVTWANARTLIFTPAEVWEPGASYTVSVAAGARAQSGARLRSPVRWSFDVRLPRVVYLGPANASQRNLFVIDLETGFARQLTDTPRGIEDFAVSPTGVQIAYTHNNEDSTSDIWLLDVASGEAHPVTRCVAALCSAPAWSPDETRLAYQRLDFNANQPGAVGQSRAWLVDLTTLGTHLLFDDAQILGAGPAWSPDGQRIAVYDAAALGIRVHDFVTDEDVIIESAQGIAGAFSPDSTRLVYPQMVSGAIGEQFYAHLEITDFAQGSITSLTGPPDAPIDDGFAAWAPDGQSLAVTRRYLDERFTPGKQLYRVDAATGDAEALVVEAAFTHAAAHWDPSGRYLVYQRFPLQDASGSPSVWLYDAQSGTTAPVADDAFLPAWVP